VEFYYEGFDGTTIKFGVRFWTAPEQKIYLKARSDAVKSIDQVLKSEGIVLPSQNVSVDFGITGGPSLREQLEGLKVIVALSQEKHLIDKKENEAET
jgi:small-conductance mechanosensitive channel